MMPIFQPSIHVINEARRAFIHTTHARMRPVCATARVNAKTQKKHEQTDNVAAMSEFLTMLASRLAMTSCDEASSARPTPAGRPSARSSR